MAFLSFFKLLSHKWNICSFYLSSFRFLSITSFSQKVTSSGNVSGCERTSSDEITLLAVTLDASGLSLRCYCCVVHISHVGLRTLNDVQASSFSLLMLSGLVPPSVTVLAFGRQVLGRLVWLGDTAWSLLEHPSYTVCTEFDFFPCMFCSSSWSCLESMPPFQYFYYCNKSKYYGSLIQAVVCIYVSDVFAAVVYVTYHLCHHFYP